MAKRSTPKKETKLDRYFTVKQGPKSHTSSSSKSRPSIENSTLFSGLCFHVFPRDISSKKSKILRENIAKHGGDLCMTISEKTTHILCSSNVKLDEVCNEIKRKPESLGKIAVVDVDWLSKSIQEGGLLSEKDYFIKTLRREKAERKKVAECKSSETLSERRGERIASHAHEPTQASNNESSNQVKQHVFHGANYASESSTEDLAESNPSLPPSAIVWDEQHVKLPHCKFNTYVHMGSHLAKWTMIKEVLTRIIKTPKQLIEAIRDMNPGYRKSWDFSALKGFFTHVASDQEVDQFFDSTLPHMQRTCVNLPNIINDPIPLLRAQVEGEVRLTQQQIYCLLCHAFFCTYPRRNSTNRSSEYAEFPSINFNSLFGEHGRGCSNKRAAKFRCLFHYFHRATLAEFDGSRIVVFRRHVIDERESSSGWNNNNNELCPVIINKNGTIEDDGKEMLQMDFANEMIGGGVLSSGCVQEEILFLICPELLLSRLFTERLHSNETEIITGVERFCKYTGYASSFRFDGNYRDTTPIGTNGIRQTEIVAIDATFFGHSNPIRQYSIRYIKRELVKALCGFQMRNSSIFSRLATGNWGCGVFGGDVQLKFVIQWLAASRGGRTEMHYFPFDKTELIKILPQLSERAKRANWTVSQLWGLLKDYIRTELHSSLLSSTDISRSLSMSSNSIDLFSFLLLHLGNSVQSNVSFSAIDSPEIVTISPSPLRDEDLLRSATTLDIEITTDAQNINQGMDQETESPAELVHSLPRRQSPIKDENENDDVICDSKGLRSNSTLIDVEGSETEVEDDALHISDWARDEWARLLPIGGVALDMIRLRGKDQVELGRGLCLPQHKKLSKKHCVLLPPRRYGEDIVVFDFSANGTFVDGKRVSPPTKKKGTSHYKLLTDGSILSLVKRKDSDSKDEEAIEFRVVLAPKSRLSLADSEEKMESNQNKRQIESEDGPQCKKRRS